MSARVLHIAPPGRLRDLMVRHLRTLGYTAAACGDGVEAIRSLREQPAAVFLVDQAVPLGGVETASLLRLHPRYGQVPSLVLAAGAAADGDEGSGLEGVHLLARPCTSADLHRALQACLRTPPEPLGIDEVRRRLACLARLPVLSRAHRRILSLLSNEDESVDVPEVVRTIEADVGLTTSILRVCNSAYFGFRGNSVDLAITFLGIDRVRSIVQAAIVFDVFAVDPRAEGEGFNILDLWRHCVACGVTMVEGGTRVKGRDHFIAGMLHDVGKIVLHLRFPDHFAEILRRTEGGEVSFGDAEQEVLGLGHSEIGYELARRWDLPPTIATCIRYHHFPGRALLHRRLSSLVHLADIAVRTMQIGHGGDTLMPRMDPAARPLARQVLGVLERQDQIAQQVETMIAEFCLDRSPQAGKEVTS